MQNEATADSPPLEARIDLVSRWTGRKGRPLADLIAALPLLPGPLVEPRIVAIAATLEWAKPGAEHVPLTWLTEPARPWRRGARSGHVIEGSSYCFENGVGGPLVRFPPEADQWTAVRTGAFKMGVLAQRIGAPIGACPFVDRRNPTLNVSWALPLIEAWHAGWQWGAEGRA